LFGHSFGALLAWRLAAWLGQRDHQWVSGLGLSARPAPTWPVDSGWHDLPTARLIDLLSGLGGLPPELAAYPELMEIVLPPLRHDLRLSDGYRHDGAVVALAQADVFFADDDVLVPAGSLSGWADVITGTVNYHQYGGGHFYLWAHGRAIINQLCAEPAELVPAGGDWPRRADRWS
jgi:surfactin synthase thioesterase subunit